MTMTTIEASDRQAAIDELQRIEADRELLLPPLRDAAGKASVRLERTRKAFAEAEAACREAQRALDLQTNRLSLRRTKAEAMLEATCDPAIDAAIDELRDEYQELAGSFREVDRVTLKGPNDSLVLKPTARTAGFIETNARIKRRMDGIRQAISALQSLKRDPAADVAGEIARIKSELPSINEG